MDELHISDPKIDFPPEKKTAGGDLKNIGSALRDLPEEFKGVIRIRMLGDNRNYQSELLVQNGFIIAASLTCLDDGAQLSADKAFFGIVDLIKESSGTFEAYALSDSEFRSYIVVNDSSLLELVRGLGRTLEEIGRVDEDIRKEGLADLEKSGRNWRPAGNSLKNMRNPTLR